MDFNKYHCSHINKSEVERTIEVATFDKIETIYGMISADRDRKCARSSG